MEMKLERSNGTQGGKKTPKGNRNVHRLCHDFPSSTFPSSI